MFTAQQVTGPVAPGQINPMQVSGPGAYYPLQTTTDPTSEHVHQHDAHDHDDHDDGHDDAHDEGRHRSCQGLNSDK